MIKLGQNATETINAGTLTGATCTAENAQSNLVLSSDKNTLYYKATDGKLWYYYNDKEHLPLLVINSAPLPMVMNNLPNWYKTPLTSGAIQGPIAIIPNPGSLYDLFYVGSDQTLYKPSWVNADNPVTFCHTGVSSTNPYYNFKEQYDSVYIQNDLTVVLSPNPSESIFNITIKNATLNSTIDLSIETINGTVIYQTSGTVPDGSGRFDFIWNAGNVSTGIYFYKVKVRGQNSTRSGKMIKL